MSVPCSSHTGAPTWPRMAHDRLGDLTDHAVPGLAVLVGNDLPEPLRVAVAAAGAQLVSASPGQITYRPGRTVTVRFDARVTWPSRATVDEVLVATTGGTLPPGALVVGNGDTRVAVWRVPHDPALPGLASALDCQTVRALLDDLGVSGGAVDVRLRAYRPLRRAVVEAVTSGARVFLKIVHPGSAEALHRRHVALSAWVPTPRSYGWSAELGIVALQALPGQTLRRALEGDGVDLPGPAGLLGLLDQVPAVGTGRVATPSASAERHGRLVAAVVPELAERIARLVAAVDGCFDSEADLVPVHGDLHEGQLLVVGRRITGLVDVDTAGTGNRVTDLSTLVGHLSTLARSSRHRSPIQRYGARLLAGFDAIVDPARLRREVAAVVLGLATGPFRVQQSGWAEETRRRVALAEQWLECATPRREVSRSAHDPLTVGGHDG